MEVLSGVSSGFAVVSLALQLAEKVTRIHDFWRSVRDAPVQILIIGLLYDPLLKTMTFAFSDRFCDSFCELLRQHRPILQYPDLVLRRCILEFCARCSFGAFKDILSLGETLLEPEVRGESILDLLARREWDESGLTARLRFLQNRGVDLLSVSKERDFTPFSIAAQSPNALKCWVASLQNCGIDDREIVAVQLSSSTFVLFRGGWEWESETLHHLLTVCKGLPVIQREHRRCTLCSVGTMDGLEHQPWWLGIGAGLSTRNCICRLLSLVGSRYRDLCPSREHECDLGWNNILGDDKVDVEDVAMEETGQNTDDDSRGPEYEDEQPDYEDEWKPGEWMCKECWNGYDERDSGSEVEEEPRLKIPGSFVY
ncbi:hypothetical protein CTA2_6698 [Colletotrichum tanaceti]|uniref:Uncharacterized protein n=1 Tax=Colletotrichum tanaceti TaxID=1306861 RepID=A0A4U6XEA8_9PEZI|nr:hypothetical protein CTA2_6698 [Colletotrichum tanaceti]TKW54131.1 hypothetical protein CTA1_6402 [Colletotrichum tanaceti]